MMSFLSKLRQALGLPWRSQEECPHAPSALCERADAPVFNPDWETYCSDCGKILIESHL